MSEDKPAKDADKTEKKDDTPKKTLSLGGGTGTLSLKASEKIRESIQKGVPVENRARRKPATPPPAPSPVTETKPVGRTLTEGERQARQRALEQALEDQKNGKTTAKPRTTGIQQVQYKKDEPVAKESDNVELDPQEAARIQAEVERAEGDRNRGKGKENDVLSAYERVKKAAKNNAPKKPATEQARRSGKLTVTQVLNEDYERDRGQSLAAQKRARERAKLGLAQDTPSKTVRDVIVPETITVQELANRMAERSGDVVKSLMKMGVMATVNEPIDADTAELLIEEFGHKIKRVTEGDIEIGLGGEVDVEADLISRPPVVTIMGHVDHGKTSLLDALRSANVVSGEAGGITQHIGAYQITVNDKKVTFLDTPGHAAFTEMRARGANVTDIVVLVVAADDSVMPQTIEAISHAKAAGVPLIVAVNKVDLPDAVPSKIKQDLLQHDVIVEDMGGETLCVEVSAKQKQNLDTLVDTILLQSEILDLKANPNRTAVCTVIESKQERGRGSVASVLVQNGTLKQGDIFVTGMEFGRVRALVNDQGKNVKEALPGQPVEVLGLNGSPNAGDDFVVVKDEAKARDISEYRRHKLRETAAAGLASTRTLENMMAAAQEGEKKVLPVVIKADVHGSVEAIAGSLHKMTEENDELEVRVLHSGVGGITESDVTLANASGAFMIGFNVRANQQARDLAQREGVDIRYYNIIYNVIDDAKAVLSGMLDPIKREEYLGQAEIREVFNITKVGKVAGCMVKTGEVKRGSHVRLLRDDVVIHEGKLKTLKRFKDEVKDVREGMECGMAFESYDDIKAGDVIECFNVVEEERKIA